MNTNSSLIYQVGQRMMAGFDGPYLDEAFIQLIKKWKIGNAYAAGRMTAEEVTQKRSQSDMADMLENLLNLPPQEELLAKLEQEGIRVHRALAPDKHRVAEWVAVHSTRNAASECDVFFSCAPITCHLATRGADILGYACYDAAALNFFGPTRVLDSEQGKGLGKALLLKSLHSMREAG